MQELRRRVQTAVEDIIDIERWDRQLAVQEVEYASIARVVEQFKNLPQIQPGH